MSKLGRFRRQNQKGSTNVNWQMKLYTAGRLMLDTFLCSKELYKAADYSISHLSSVLLSKTFKDVDSPLACYSDAKSLKFLLSTMELSALLQYEVMVKLEILELTKVLKTRG